jgi:hypothetical protein
MKPRAIFWGVLLVILAVAVIRLGLAERDQSQLRSTPTFNAHYSDMLTHAFATSYALQTLTPAATAAR